MNRRPEVLVRSVVHEADADVPRSSRLSATGHGWRHWMQSSIITRRHCQVVWVYLDGLREDSAGRQFDYDPEIPLSLGLVAAYGRIRSHVLDVQEVLCQYQAL